MATLESPARIVTLTTDFGHRDGFVGAMKGVILSINPRAVLVDIAHDVPRQNIAAGARVLTTACSCFPPDSIHLVVIDPGVGTSRLPVIVHTKWGFFVVPDNGLIDDVCSEIGMVEARKIEAPFAMLGDPSQTFHGRDIFAPAAAHLSLGRPLSDFGPVVSLQARYREPGLRRLEDGDLIGEVIYEDVYGNLITNIPSMRIEPGKQIHVAGRVLPGMVSAYAEGEPDTLIAVPGSEGTMELAVNGGSAAALLGASIGLTVEIREGDNT